MALYNFLATIFTIEGTEVVSSYVGVLPLDSIRDVRALHMYIYVYVVSSIAASSTTIKNDWLTSKSALINSIQKMAR